MIRIYDESYWFVNGIRYKNKFKALNASKNKISNVGFYYANSTFDNQDWTQDPEQSWASMMIQRAYQIRDSFEYIRLWYSGGSDSQTMLNVFLSEEIHIDEICCHLVSPIDDFLGKNNIEQNLVAIPFLDSIRSSIPKTKITINRLGRDHFNKLLTDDWLYTSADMSMIQDQPAALYNTGIVNEVGQNYCDLQGGDKPVLFLEDGDYYGFMVDETFAARINSVHVEEFYTTPNFPEMHVKQCHMAQKYLRENYPDQEPGIIFKYMKKEIEQQTGMRHPLFKNIDLGKEDSNVVGSKSSFLLEQAKQKNQAVYNKYTEFLKYEAGKHTQRFNNRDLYSGFCGILSGKYKLS